MVFPGNSMLLIRVDVASVLVLPPHQIPQNAEQGICGDHVGAVRGREHQAARLLLRACVYPACQRYVGTLGELHGCAGRALGATRIRIARV